MPYVVRPACPSCDGDVRPTDPIVYAAIVLTMGLAGFAACVVPARRATRVELVDALRPD